MMVPPGTSCPPKAFTPSRCALESRPFLELPKPFLCAITSSILNFGQQRGKAPRKLFLFALSGRFLGCALFRLRLALRLAFSSFCALGFAFSSFFGLSLLGLA